MPLNQEKRSNITVSNNNDHNYLHKKFKKMASTIPVLPSNQSRGQEIRQKEINVIQNASNAPITNGSISAAHPEIEKIKEKQHRQHVDAGENNVQINYNDENSKLDNVNTVQLSGQTSLTDEFLNKTENLENDFIRDAYNGTVGGRYICPYCKLSCAKPSVLQKHIRAHTNERPYPCIPCGFAFKTKSNLYKHCRSRMHALRLQGTDIPMTLNDDEMSGGSESDTPTSISEAGSDVSNCRIETLDYKPEPERLTDITQLRYTNTSPSETSKSKTIYKPKFRAGVAFYRESDEKEKLKKSISPNADFLNEHISKIISDNEAIIDVIETPLQKKYGKIKQIAESKQLMNDINEIKSDSSPLNLTKNNNETEVSFRKRSHSESFSQGHFQKHPLNPEGSIIKDLLLKTKMDGMVPITGELLEGPLFLCPVCQIMYRSADNLEIHRLYYCKGNVNSNVVSDSKDLKVIRTDNIFVRSNSVNVRLPESSSSAIQKSGINSKSAPARLKPENLVITKAECNDVVAPLPSPGPLLGNTRLVDSRIPSEFARKNDVIKSKPIASPKRKIDSHSDAYSPRLVENVSPRSTDLYSHPKLRCVETNSNNLRSIEEISPNLRINSTSLQMFGGEVKIVDHSGSTTTLRIEPNKNQLSPIMIQTNLSPSKLISDIEASSVVVRSGLHSGGTIVHNPPTPKENLSTPQPQTPRMTISTTGVPNSNLPNIHDITHFQFPPLSAITAFNPLTLPPLSPSASVSPNGATKIMHGGKLIPHVPGIPGPNTPSRFIGNTNTVPKNLGNNDKTISIHDDKHSNLGAIHPIKSPHVMAKYDTQQLRNTRSPNLRIPHMETEKHVQTHEHSEVHYISSIPIINVNNAEDTKIYSSNTIKQLHRQDVGLKRNAEGVLRTPVLKENVNFPNNKNKNKAPGLLIKTLDIKNEKEIRNFNFENLITKTEIFNNQVPTSCDIQKNNTQVTTSCATPQNERSEPLYFQKNIMVKSANGERKPKFLRPSTLPLKPGTFTPKRHHGITPNANTMPLVSPETPRPAKAYGQLYLNGNAYTYLGLKCSTKVFYCTINRPQPTYVPNQHFLSMYSNWQLLSELTPDPLGLSASSAMSLYDSRHRPQNMSVAVIKHDLILTHSSQWNTFIKEKKQVLQSLDVKKIEENKSQIMSESENLMTPKKELTGGFESNEEYTYVRGRGRGRYVCSECGIRCKKPSMLKKHIRTHTDVRPYTCVHCAFSFKTKGNLTKHMKSKAHYKKCCELGINPNEGDCDTNEMAQCSGETDDDTDSDGDEGNEGETESSDTEAYKSRLPEHEAAHCLLSLGGNRPSTSATPGLLTSARPTTYPYAPVGLECIEIYTEQVRDSSVDVRVDAENEPIDLSKNDVKTPNIPEIPTARESSVLASLASNTAKLPQAPNQWTNGEPLLHTYLTERALLDTKIKQSQVTSCLSKHKNIDLEKSAFTDDAVENQNNTEKVKSLHYIKNDDRVRNTNECDEIENNISSVALNDMVIDTKDSTIMNSNVPIDMKKSFVQNSTNSNAENAKHVVSEYLKQAKINLIKAQEDMSINQSENFGEEKNGDDILKSDEFSDSETMKSSSILEHDSVATKVVIGVGGVAFKVTKGKELESSSYPPGRIMEDGCRDCNFCNKTFTKPSQLRLHLNIHYMERPFRCSICAVSFRTRGHLQKHERSASHHNKISMTSTFGAATSFNPRPFRCSDCNIAFRIHGHLAKHLRSKMHVMRLECLFKLPFGTFTEIERAGVSLTDIDTTDCDSSLASLQLLARKLHEKDPTKLEYRDPNGLTIVELPAGRELSEDEDNTPADNACVSEKNSNGKTSEGNEDQEMETRVNCSATDI
ncbi:uncharacterized protein LOC101737452 isoform X2 [Bombyx mori]|nr:uncharacterized protein LOC101737452 isoform X2 [Bombyx mori]XP_037866946.1 uncharacterized protein LOC101737452 isoform X2 [Bombyx mori]